MLQKIGETMMHLFPELFLKQKIIEVDDYPQELTRCLTKCAPNKVKNEPKSICSSDSRYL